MMYRLHGVLLNVVGGVWCSVSDRPLEEVLVKNTLIYCSFTRYVHNIYWMANVLSLEQKCWIKAFLFESIMIRSVQKSLVLKYTQRPYWIHGSAFLSRQIVALSAHVSSFLNLLLVEYIC
jgi:hypothetical protein